MRSLPAALSFQSAILRTALSQVEPNIWYCTNSTQVCYTVSDEQTTFSKAKTYCDRFDTYVTSITSKEENSDVADVCGCQSCWIGLVEDTEGDWYWVDGTNSTYRNWHGQSSSILTNEILAVINMVKPGVNEISRTWWDVGYGFNLGAAICKLNKTDVLAKGFSSKALSEIAKQECIEQVEVQAKQLDWPWLLAIGFVTLSCCAGIFYYWYKFKKRASHLRAQEEAKAPKRYREKRKEVTFSDLFDNSRKCNNKINRELEWDSHHNHSGDIQGQGQGRQKTPDVLEKLIKTGRGKPEKNHRGAKTTRDGGDAVKKSKRSSTKLRLTESSKRETEGLTGNQQYVTRGNGGNDDTEVRNEREEGEQSQNAVLSPQMSYRDEGQ
jgi:phage gp46-like protein